MQEGLNALLFVYPRQGCKSNTNFLALPIDLKY